MHVFSIVGAVLCEGGNLGNEAVKEWQSVSLKYTKTASARWCIPHQMQRSGHAVLVGQGHIEPLKWCTLGGLLHGD